LPSDQTICIVASGHAHPTQVVTSDELAESVPGLQAGWSEKRLGIRTRHLAGPHEHVADLAIASLHGALELAGWSGSDLDAVICGTSFADDLLPATASLIARDVAPTAVAFDVNAACASVPYGLVLAESLLTTRPELARMAVCVSEHPSAWADYQDRDSSVFWGDSAGCLLVERGEPAQGFRLVASALANDATYAEKVRVRRGGVFHHDGRYSRTQVIELTQRTSLEVLAAAGLDIGDVVAFVGHQSNIPLLEDVGLRLGVDWDRQWHNVEWAGNQGGAGVLTAFSQGWQAHAEDLEPGDHVLLATVGGGYSAGAVLLEWMGASA
jgi:3-oxoacyl-[acyl-carrier-protein] synthase III